MTTEAIVSFRPLNLGRWLVWGVTVLVLLVAPLVFSSGFSITLLSQMGIMVIFCLSYNMLLGQGGMLSFGHALYSGLGAFFAVHTMNWVTGGHTWFPESLIPLVGGVAGAIFGVIFGFVTTKKSGTPFSMITLGLGEMVFASSLMFPDFFGGEGGVSTDRVIGEPVFGITYGPGIQVYYLIAAWCLVSMIGMYAFAQTPLGRISNAVRDNPERVEFIGYNTQRVRYLVLIASAFFAGISGGLSAINFELVTADNLSSVRSAFVLMATFIGGAGFFFGPVIGAIIFVMFSVALSEYTQAWLFYLGAFFVLMVMYAPGGLSSVVMLNLRVYKHRMLGAMKGAYAGVVGTGLLLLLAVIIVVELGYHWSLNRFSGTVKKVFGIAFDTGSPTIWAGVLILLLVVAAAFRWACRRFARQWDTAQERIAVIEAAQAAKVR